VRERKRRRGPRAGGGQPGLAGGGSDRPGRVEANGRERVEKREREVGFIKGGKAVGNSRAVGDFSGGLEKRKEKERKRK